MIDYELLDQPVDCADDCEHFTCKVCGGEVERDVTPGSYGDARHADDELLDEDHYPDVDVLLDRSPDPTVKAGQLWRHKLNGTVIEILAGGTGHGDVRYRTRGVIPTRSACIHTLMLPKLYALLEDHDV